MSMPEFYCVFCGKERKSRLSLVCHQAHCALNPQRKASNLGRFLEKGHSGTNQYIKNPETVFSEASKAKIRQRLVGKPLSAKRRAAISVSMHRAVLEGRQKTPKPGGITRKFAHTNWKGELEALQGSWELKLALFFDLNQIVWTKEIAGFDYLYQDVTRTYFPDFYLAEWNLYVEVKG